MREHDIEEYREMWGIYYPNTLGEYNLTKEEGVFRIAAVGDSFTQGGGYVDGKDLLSDSFPDYLEDMLNNNFDDRKYEVLNFGFSSTTPLEVYYITNEVVLDYKPDLVILGVTANDRWFGIYNLNPVVYCDINISSEERFRYHLHRTWKLFSYLETKLSGFDFYIDAVEPKELIGMRCVDRSYHGMSYLLSDEGIPVFGVFINDVMYYNNPELPLYRDHHDFEKAIGPFNKSLFRAGIPVVYTPPYFLDLPYKDFVADDLYHYNHKGNRIVAQIVYNYILENKMIPSCDNNADCASRAVDVES